MHKTITAYALIVATTLFFAGPSRAAGNVALATDLTAVIALLGLPCGKVASVVHLGDSDNIAVCEDGNRYRVFLSAEGRVVAEKQSEP